jgi:uncharacterized protein YbbC (DUF1343 family)
MNRRGLPGVFFRPVVFEPTFHKHAGKACAGVQIHPLNRQTFRPVESAVALIEGFRSSGPDLFKWKDPPYEYELEKNPFDVLAGSPGLREQIESGVPAREIARSWDTPVGEFRKIRERFLIY